MLSTEDLNLGQLRLLEVDNRIIVPVNTTIRLIVTSSDVIHSFGVPSLGLKLDAIPGRLNQTSFFIDRPGVYYGQCSELCLRLDRYVIFKEVNYLLASFIVCSSIIYDVILCELELKQVGEMISRKSFSLTNKIKTFINLNVGRLLWSSSLFESALTRYRDYGGFLKKLILNNIILNIKNMI